MLGSQAVDHGLVEPLDKLQSGVPADKFDHAPVLGQVVNQCASGRSPMIGSFGALDIDGGSLRSSQVQRTLLERL